MRDPRGPFTFTFGVDMAHLRIHFIISLYEKGNPSLLHPLSLRLLLFFSGYIWSPSKIIPWPLKFQKKEKRKRDSTLAVVLKSRTSNLENRKYWLVPLLILRV